MTDLFYMGGPLYMGILTILLLIILALAIYRTVQILGNQVEYETTFRHYLTHIKSLGLFTLVVGILSQLIGLYQAFSAIEQAGAVSPALLAGGLKVSMITTIYGMIIFVLSYLIWLGLDYLAGTKLSRAE